MKNWHDIFYTYYQKGASSISLKNALSESEVFMLAVMLVFAFVMSLAIGYLEKIVGHHEDHEADVQENDDIFFSESYQEKPE